MTELPMPSELKRAAAADGLSTRDVETSGGADGSAPTTTTLHPPEPASVKLIVRLFVIPLLIVAAAVGVMFLIGLLAGGAPTLDEAMTGMEEQGGQRTGGILVGPGSKQRYMYAKAIADGMKQKMQAGMTEAERVQFAGRLMGIVDKAQPDEGEVKHFLILALGRVWQADPRQEAMDSPAAAQS